MPLYERRTRALSAGRGNEESHPGSDVPSGRMILRLIDRLEQEKIPSDKILEIVKSMGDA